VLSWDPDTFQYAPEVVNASIVSVTSREVNFCKDVTYLVPIDGSNVLTLYKAVTFCKKFRGKMALPESLEDEQTWCKKYQSTLAVKHFYLPIHDNDGENLWTWEGGNGTNRICHIQIGKRQNQMVE
jgi:hypothetical protein